MPNVLGTNNRSIHYAYTRIFHFKRNEKVLLKRGEESYVPGIQSRETDQYLAGFIINVTREQKIPLL